MSEKEPGSLERRGSLKCQRSCSSSNIPPYFACSAGCRGLSEKGNFGAAQGGIICCEVLWLSNVNALVSPRVSNSYAALHLLRCASLKWLHRIIPLHKKVWVVWRRLLTVWEGIGPDPRKRRADARLLLRLSLGQSPYYVSAVRKCVCFTGCTGVSIYARLLCLTSERRGRRVHAFSLTHSVTRSTLVCLFGAVTFPSSSCTSQLLGTCRVSEHIRFVGALIIFTPLRGTRLSWICFCKAAEFR